ncbi:MAG TPA: NlpC/P60 family protein [Gemmatimonadales bacterium]|nr:NlpC/P60 family protein [Gemmatimonadales bacterium]
MKLVVCALSLLAGLPSLMSAQISFAVPRLQGPTVRATLGPIAVVATLGGHRGRVSPAGAPRRTPASRARAGSVARASAARVLATAKRYVGTRYRYGGGSPDAGFDCSGFVQYVFGRNGVQLPRTSLLQASAGRPAPLDVASLEPGDLLLFASRGTQINHVAIYVGGNRILHSTAGAGGVVYDDLTTPRGKWYLARHVVSRRVL